MARKKNGPANDAVKQAKKERQAQKANRKALRTDELCEEDVPIDVLISRLDIRGEGSADYPVSLEGPPSARASLTFISLRGSSFILFGGEYFDAKSCIVYNDTIKWAPGKDEEWKRACCLPAPKPRVGHAAVLLDDDIYVFGGEFATVNQFHHFRDMWRLDTKSLRWEELSTSGTSPSPRSGHRMVVCRNCIFLFGGFHESSRETRYYNDLFMYSPGQAVWRKFSFPPGTHMPSSRSGVTMSSTSDGLFIHGGYARLKDTNKGVQGKTLSDGWWLDLRPVFADVKAGMPVWEKLPKRGQAPLRNGCAVASHKSCVYLFGGVVDEDEGGLTMRSSIFFNDICMFDLGSRNWIRLGARAGAVGTPQNRGQQIGYEERLGRLLKRVIPTTLKNSDGEPARDPSGMTNASEEVVPIDSDPRKLAEPLPRLNASMCVKDNCLYVMGGSLELGRKTIVFDDCWKYGIKSGRWENVLPGTYWMGLQDILQGRDSSESSSASSEEQSSDEETLSSESSSQEGGASSDKTTDNDGAI